MAANDDDVSSVEISDGEKEEKKDAAREEFFLTDPNVVTKYKTAADIANRALAHVIGECTEGKKIVEICVSGDAFIVAQCATVYGKGKIEKGVAFPTCISVNNCVGHYSPLVSEGEAALARGDVVKIDLGVHIDGCPAVVAHTIVVGATAEAPATGKQADVIAAANTAAEVVQRALKPGAKNSEITALLAKVAQEYGVSNMEGVLSHEMKRFVVDGTRSIANKTTADQQVEEVTFENGSVWGVDIVMSTGEGKNRQLATRTTVFKRAVETTYRLKMKAARACFSEINANFPALPFTLRAMSDEKRARLGITEMLNHDLVNSYPVLYEQDGVFVAHVKFTALIMPAGTVSRITQGPALVGVKSEVVVQDEALKKVLATSVNKKKNKKKNKKGGKAAAGGADEEGDDDEEETPAGGAAAAEPAAKKAAAEAPAAKKAAAKK